MSTVETRFIEPLDVLFLRGNKLFGDPGSHGESLVPPWPSVAAGALRSRILVDDCVDLAAFARGEWTHPTLGTPTQPGAFAVTAFHLARRVDGRVEALIAPPADLVISENADGEPSVRALKPAPLAAGLLASTPFAELPVLAESTRGKPASGYWLTEAGWKRYLAGETPWPAELVKSSALWSIDPRVGVGLDAATGRASDGKLFSVQAVTMIQRGHRINPQKSQGKSGNETPLLADYDVGFLATVTGAALPSGGTLRLGGDGRAAAIHTVDVTVPEPDYAAMAAAKRCRIVLATPGVFEQGWLPTGITQTTDGAFLFDLHGVRGELTCAAVPRAEIVSGWDLAANHGRGQPKPALRAVSTGSVYWLTELDASAEALRKLVASGLWNDPCEDTARRAEGFNRIALAAY